jgi:hypothetical protein
MKRWYEVVARKVGLMPDALTQRAGRRADYLDNLHYGAVGASPDFGELGIWTNATHITGCEFCRSA